jgi:IS30 family transposase
MTRTYHQLTQTERYQIQALKALNLSARTIAKTLQRSNKTITTELKRCEPSPYCAKTAQAHAEQKRTKALKFTKLTALLKRNVDGLLQLNLSPEQIAGRLPLKHEKQLCCISTSTLYRWIHHLGWTARLPRKGKPYKARPTNGAGVRLIPNRVDISQRPAIVAENIEIGHWEGDTVYGKDGYFVTLVERRTKLYLVRRVKNKTKQEVGKAVISLLRPFKKHCKTITFDNGGEFAGHAKMAKKLGCKVYFARPYCSWQRGLNENSNGLLRRYFPKGTAIAGLSAQEIELAVYLINLRPRKALNYLNPIEYFFKKRVSLMMTI